MEAAGRTRGEQRNGVAGDGQDLAALRAQVERTIAHNRKLREMARRTGHSPEDVASEALARYLAASGEGIDNPAAWMVSAGRNFVYDLHRRGLQRETAADPASRSLEQPRRGEDVPVDERLDRRYENKLYDAAVGRLDRRDQRAIAAFELAGSMRAVEKEYGIPKSSVQRAFKRLQAVISSETGRQATRRARSRALAYHLGHLSAPQVEEIRARMKWDTGLLMAVRSLEVGGRRAVALLPPGGMAADAGTRSSGFADRMAAVVDRVREGAVSLASRGGGHEAETATGIASSGAGAGFATKAIVAACIGGSAAAGVGGACVATGVVDLPGKDSKPIAENTVPEEPARTPTLHWPGSAVHWPGSALPRAGTGTRRSASGDDRRKAGSAGDEGALRRRLDEQLLGFDLRQPRLRGAGSSSSTSSGGGGSSSGAAGRTSGRDPIRRRPMLAIATGRSGYSASAYRPDAGRRWGTHSSAEPGAGGLHGSAMRSEQPWVRRGCLDALRDHRFQHLGQQLVWE